MYIYTVVYFSRPLCVVHRQLGFCHGGSNCRRTKWALVLVLPQVLARCNLQKHLLTNADCRHAVKCLKRLGISDCFQVGQQRCGHLQWVASTLGV
jgi:hypothetical protein